MVLFIGIIFLYGLWLYNDIIKSDENCKAAWSQVLNQYQRRSDLIPNLVDTVKAYAAHERETFTLVTEARSKVNNFKIDESLLTDPQKLQQFQKVQGELSGALARLMVVVEKYPDLKANTNFLALQSQLEGTENRIAVERMRFIEMVNTYNKTVRTIPGSFFGFPTKPNFTAEEGTEKAPKNLFK
ncbi:MAG: LemA family protein [Planctomycetota bacterium]|nr:LemA family protein [Planctomycetota bacterium]MDI6787671.1 LemA family protein [Planctomycetota bacterium]